MKKILSLLLVFVLCLSLCACDKDDGSIDNPGQQIGGNGEQQDGNNSEIGVPLVVQQGSGSAYINTARLHEIVQTIQLTTENWKDYIRVYSYSYDVVEAERDAFGEVISTKTTPVTGCQIGADNTRFHCFEDVAIELKNKSTNEVISYPFSYAGYWLEEPIDLSQYECTRIQGVLHFVDLPEEVIIHVEYDVNRYFDMGAVMIDGSTGEMMSGMMYPTTRILPGTNAIDDGNNKISQVLKENS